jgi:hypothetical protein
MKVLTQAAQAAKAIKQELKLNFPGCNFSVKSDNYSMGDSVRIHWTDGPTEKMVDAITCKYQYGSFNGMEDIYELTNRRNDIPQSKYVQTSRSRSDEIDLIIIESLKKEFDPEFSTDKHYGHCWGSQMIWQKFSEMDLSAKVQPKEETKINGSFVIVDYSDKAVAVFGETKAIKENLKSLGGRFNPYLNNSGQKQAGWIFPKTKKNELESLLTANIIHTENSEQVKEQIIINQSESLRKKAESVRNQASKINTSVSGNWTYRRQNIADGQQRKQDNLIKTAVILETLAQKWDDGTIDKDLQRIKSVADVELFLHGSYPQKPDSSFNGWYAKEYPARKKKVDSLGIIDENHFKIVKNLLINISVIELTDEQKKEKELNELLKEVRKSNIPGFFPTPDKLIDQMIELLEITEPVKNILEPSAGIGSICEKVEGLCTRLECCELQYSLSNILMKKGFNVVCNNIYDITGRNDCYDAIIMNPPFENREDLKQIMFCYNLLNDTGKLVSIISAGSWQSENGQSKEFKNWLSDKTYEIIDVDQGSFKDSFNSTGVSVKIILINK